MNLNHLYYFKTLARLEHYTKAAQELSITQPSLSHAIASIEGELGISLFQKQGRNVVLTKYGKMFLRYVEASLDLLESGVKKTKAMTGNASGVIDLGFIYTLGSHFIPDLVNEFRELDPTRQMTFTFSQGVTADILMGLKNEKYDVAFCSMVEGEKEVDFIPVTEEELVVIVPKEHPLSGRTDVDLEEIVPYDQVYFSKSSGLRPVIDGLFTKIGQEPKIVYEIEEDTAVAGFVAGGFGIAIVPNIPIIKHLDLDILSIKTPDYKRYIYMAKMKNRYLSPAVQEFVGYVIENKEISIPKTKSE